MIEHAILLSAGQGSRMLPLTAERPKCLIEFSGRTLLEWQVEMLARGGVKHIDVVTGFMTDMGRRGDRPDRRSARDDHDSLQSVLQGG